MGFWFLTTEVHREDIKTGRHPLHHSIVAVSTISRSLGPSNSIRTIRCQVPSSIFPFSNGNATEVPISADKIDPAHAPGYADAGTAAWESFLRTHRACRGRFRD